MKYLKLFILVFIIFIFSGCSKTIIDELPEGYFFELKKIDIDVYSETYLRDIVKTTNIKYNKKIQLDTSSLGKKESFIKFVVDKNTYIYHFNYTVKDLSKPRILSSGDRYIPVNSDVFLCDYIMYGDEYDNEPVCRVEGTYDLNKIGNYEIKYIVSDNSGNEEIFETVLHVIKEIKTTSSSNNQKNYFNTLYKKHKNENTMIGIDVSEWQGDIDFDKVKSSGVEFVIIRIGLELSDSKKVVLDKKYKENIQNAKDVGLKVGVYFYTTALTIDEINEQTDWIIKTLDGYDLDLPIAFDWERFDKWNTLKMSFHDINSLFDTFINNIEEKGYEGILYSSKFYLENIWKTKSDKPVWLAHYSKETDYEGNYLLWQICNNGVINGINGDVDIDIMYLKDK